MLTQLESVIMHIAVLFFLETNMPFVKILNSFHMFGKWYAEAAIICLIGLCGKLTYLSGYLD